MDKKEKFNSYMREYNNRKRIASAKPGEVLKECAVCGGRFRSLGNHMVIHEKELKDSRNLIHIPTFWEKVKSFFQIG